MTVVGPIRRQNQAGVGPAAVSVSPPAVSPLAARVLFASLAVGVTTFTILSGDASGSAAATLQAGADLTRLLRFMAAIKAVLALGAAIAVFWRLGTAVRPLWLGAYGAAVCAMITGPGLIWGMVHVGLGALLLHGGLAASVLLLWNDPAMSGRLEALLVRRKGVRRSAALRQRAENRS